MRRITERILPILDVQFAFKLYSNDWMTFLVKSTTNDRRFLSSSIVGRYSGVAGCGKRFNLLSTRFKDLFFKRMYI